MILGRLFSRMEDGDQAAESFPVFSLAYYMKVFSFTLHRIWLPYLMCLMMSAAVNHVEAV